ncbi:hypothetical protein SPRG_17465 [Saprolegnia parasitica CBS 223.65]|uniref:Uncharacterized protein n=1 Tax=Saprolegnia parasitica (strain CBS 223.65) TaxID=695850 RepID=A0A067BK79_SAPPC|nr:hypothetical protein SPRG_17465 [Saprolegnia parasitica CBS 223.65]KDO17125.1 hypothetical protein SPRG_17465 [Saprolegnia parasitica CBS 223.65]|eukprot:XP_012212168.1 hypothetical protein SPRG_17465 [Saprolegnia parasitica CBS 223.65]
MVASSDASIWKLQELANGRYTIRSNNILTKSIGPSLNRAPGVIDPNQVVFAYDLSTQSNVTEWTCREIGDKKITLQNAYTGGYLSRCEGCQPSAQTAPSDFEPTFALAMPHGNQGLASQQWSYTYF